MRAAQRAEDSRFRMFKMQEGLGFFKKLWNKMKATCRHSQQVYHRILNHQNSKYKSLHSLWSYWCTLKSYNEISCRVNWLCLWKNTKSHQWNGCTFLKVAIINFSISSLHNDVIFFKDCIQNCIRLAYTHICIPRSMCIYWQQPWYIFLDAQPAWDNRSD